MNDVKQWTWKLDMSAKTCFNEENKVIVKIEKAGKELKGKILDMSNELFDRIAGLINGPMVVQQITLAAEYEFLRANGREI